jgi:hypothetical protein
VLNDGYVANKFDISATKQALEGIGMTDTSGAAVGEA